MAAPWHHAISSSRKWGGRPEDYLEIHEWFDVTKAHHADFRHRALRHHAEGIFLMESIFGVTIDVHVGYRCPTCGENSRAGVVEHEEECKCPASELEDLWKKIPTRWVGEQHVTEDLGRIPSATEWLSAIQPAPWMNRSRRLSRELDAAEV